MRWRQGASGNVEDRRGRRAAVPVGVGLIGNLVALILLLSGGGGYDVNSPFEQFPGQSQPASGTTTMERAPDAESELVDFLSFVVGDLQKFWADDFERAGRPFQPTKLVVFRQATDTGCGVGSAQTGPFYCPLDQQVYLDLGFFKELASRSARPATSRRPTCIAHEFGHHVQTLIGIAEQVDAGAAATRGANELSVAAGAPGGLPRRRVGELRAGTRAPRAGDIEEGLAPPPRSATTASRRTSARVVPESFTHGTRSSASAGSSAASTPATRRPATRSRTTFESLVKTGVVARRTRYCRAWRTDRGTAARGPRHGHLWEEISACRHTGCRPSTPHFSPSKVQAPTCTSAGPRPSRRPRTRRPRASKSCSTTSRAASAALPATASGSRPTRSASTRRCGSTPRSSTPASTSTTPPPSSWRTSPTRCSPSRCAATARCGSSGSPPSLADGRIGLVGKAHHCMVDGLAAVELGSLLLDADPAPVPDPAEVEWLPAPAAEPRSSCWPAAPGTARASSSRCCGPRCELARAPLAPAGLRLPDRPRAGGRGPPVRTAERVQRARARPTATSPPRAGRSTSCARSAARTG